MKTNKPNLRGVSFLETFRIQIESFPNERVRKMFFILRNEEFISRGAIFYYE